MNQDNRRVFSRFYVWSVVFLWVGSMTWLIVAKVIPTLLIGEPPTLQRVIGPEGESPPCGWRVLLAGRPTGWSLSEIVAVERDITEIRSQTYIKDVSLEETFPAMRALIKWLIGPEASTRFSLRTKSAVVVDPLGRLISFDSDVVLEPFYLKITLEGVVTGERLLLTVRFGETKIVREVPIRPHELIGDRFSPQMRLPGLRKNQTWTVPIYNPLRVNAPVEFLEAKVEGRTHLSWNGRLESVWLVVYREDSGSGLGGSDRPQGKLWVREDGTVLQNEMLIMGTPIRFVRFTDEETAELMKKLGIEKL